MTVDPARDRLRLLLDDADGAPLHSFDQLRAMLAGQGEQLTFAMNAGMSSPATRPMA